MFTGEWVWSFFGFHFGSCAGCCTISVYMNPPEVAVARVGVWALELTRLEVRLVRCLGAVIHHSSEPFASPAGQICMNAAAY